METINSTLWICLMFIVLLGAHAITSGINCLLNGSIPFVLHYILTYGVFVGIVTAYTYAKEDKDKVNVKELFANTGIVFGVFIVIYASFKLFDKYSNATNIYTCTKIPIEMISNILFPFRHDLS